MGTRSLLGYELPNGKIYAQYLQFDGGPENQGHDYFIGVLQGLANLQCVDEGKPNAKMFKRIRHFLDEQQYQSGHSVDTNFTCTRKEWFSLEIDYNQEWQYLFTLTGDFIYFKPEEKNTQIVIPWELIKCILNESHDLLGSSHFPKGLRNSPWWEATRFNDYEENKKVMKWGKNVALHINDELEHESSKLLKEKLLKGEPAILPEPILKIEYGKIRAFHEQGDEGFRSYFIMTVGTTLNPTTVKSMFADYKDERKDQGTIEAQYLRGKKRIKE
jgi:hypothetical protein